MTRLIKKYKNRRLYDTQTSQYITLEQLHRYVIDGEAFKVEDSETGSDLTNSILLQIIVEMEASNNPFLSAQILRQIICLAHHPMNHSLKMMMEHLFHLMGQSLETRHAAPWNQQMQEMMQQWQNLFQGK